MGDIKIIKQKARVISNIRIADNIYQMILETGLCKDARPGQFVMIYPPNGARLLGRPVCIADATDQTVKIVFRTVGDGTRDIASRGEGDHLEIEGPFGNGYPSDVENNKVGDIVLLGGGLGIPSLLFLAKNFAADGKSISAVLGYRDGNMKEFLSEDFRALDVNTVIATEDGSSGIKGNVLDPLKNGSVPAGLIYACGPLPMLAAVKDYAGRKGIRAYISLEEHMACGIGVCLGCVVKTHEKDMHSNVCNARVCTEGPVFEAQKVNI